MTVGELKRILEKFDDKIEIIISRDSEGNKYSLLHDVDDYCVFDKETNTIYDCYWTAEQADMVEREWYEMTSRSKCLVFYPES